MKKIRNSRKKILVVLLAIALTALAINLGANGGQKLGDHSGLVTFAQGLPSSGAAAHLNVHDHTLMMKAVLENRTAIRRQLYAEKFKFRPDHGIEFGQKIINILLGLRTVSAETKASLKKSLVGLSALHIRPPSASEKASLQEILKRLRTQPLLPGKLKILGQLNNEFKGRPAWANGIDFARKMLEDGSSTIYSPDFLRQLPKIKPLAQLALNRASRLGTGNRTSAGPKTDEQTCYQGDDDAVDCWDGGGGGYGSYDPFGWDNQDTGGNQDTWGQGPGYDPYGDPGLDPSHGPCADGARADIVGGIVSGVLDGNAPVGAFLSSALDVLLGGC